MSKVEAEIATLEKEIITLDAKIAEDFEAVSNDPDFYSNYQAKKDRLDVLMEDWSELEDLVNA